MDCFVIELETPRLRLRQWKLDDFDWYAGMCADQEVMRFLGGKTFTRLEAWRQFCSLAGHWQFRGYGLWAVEEKASGQLLGRVGIIDHEGYPGFEIAWTLARGGWGRGYATEAARRSMQYAFEDLKRDRVISLIDPENKPSRSVAERLGETVQGMTELMGTNVLVYGMGRDEWFAGRR